YQSRTTYNGQLTGKHTLGDDDKLDWSAGYAYANRNMPDRRRYTTVLDPESGQMEVDNLNDVNREYNRLDEHIGSAGVNYTHDFRSWAIPVTLKAGGYGQYRSRVYNTRYFLYSWPGGLPVEYRTMDVPTELMRDENYGADKLYLVEQVDWRNNYKGNDLTGAAYVGGNFTFGRFNAYAGVRYEYYRMNLTSNTRKAEESPEDNIYNYNDLFPSVNMAYRFDDRHVLRLYYGRSVNRPEFRELSTSVYYDFDLASNIQGNYDLRPAYIDNIDLGYSFYPSSGELLSVSLFYKHFRDPIEWTYTVAGGTDLIYSYLNAKGADNYGVEVDIRKSLDFIGLPDFSLNVNGALIHSRVKFEPGSKEHDRPMQGQSPYLVNAGLFYRNERAGVSASLMYNCIGKRIVGVGRKVGYEGMEVKVPDSYEMPRNTIDLNVTKTLGDFELRFGVRDLLAEKASFIQYENTPAGKIKQVNRQYRPGRTFNLSFTYKFTAK
ncbi:MAG TPA: ligand-gated channel protein, partial [Porphyromonadaceae bacterium]|nr:ligand-gated channel protein [Porphyromonadaceae bacterium]